MPALLAMGLAVVYSATRSRTYSSTAAFVAQQRRAPSALTGLAAQLGVGVALSDPMQSPQFYADLVGSPAILQPLASTEYEVATDSGSITGSLYELYRPIGPTEAHQHEALLRRLRREVRAGVNQQTGVIRLTVTSPYRDLSRQLADRLVALVHEFNLDTRQSQARSERRFIEERLLEVRRELREAENRLESFLVRNRELAGSPALSFERDRLQRELSMRQAVYTSLAQSHEEARIEEVRDTPVITLLEAPQLPAFANSRRLARNGLVALVLGALFGVMLALGREYFAQARRWEADEYEQFARLRQDAIGDVIHPWRPVARLLTRRGTASG